MNLIDRLKSAHSFHGDPLHREAWEYIERLQKANHLLADIANDAVGWLPLASVNGPREEYQDKIKELTDGHC